MILGEVLIVLEWHGGGKMGGIRKNAFEEMVEC